MKECCSAFSLVTPFESVLVFGFACKCVTAHPNRHGDRSKTTLLNHSSFFYPEHLELCSPSHTLSPSPTAFLVAAGAYLSLPQHVPALNLARVPNR